MDFDQWKHGIMINEVMKDPKIVGLEKAIMLCVEPLIFDDYGRLLKRPDIFGYDMDKGYFLIECKTGYTSRGSALNQLRIASNHLQAHDVPGFEQTPYRLYVHGKDFKTEVIK